MAAVTEPTKKRGWNDYRRKIRAVGRVTLHFRNDTPESLAIYTTYLPHMLHQQILDESFASGAQRDFSGNGKTIEAALIFSDASGFTAVSALRTRAMHARAFVRHGEERSAPLLTPLTTRSLASAPSRSPLLCASTADRDARAPSERRRGDVPHHE